MRRPLAPLALAGLLAGCTLGPKHIDAHPSLPPSTAAVAPTTPIRPAAGPDQTLSEAAPVPTEWWRAFGNPTLDALVARALQSNNDIATAEFALRQAAQQARAVAAVLRPSADVGYQAQRYRTSAIYSPPLADPNNFDYTLHTAQLTVSYPLDIFGANRSRALSARAAAQVQQERFRAARTTVIANLVQAVVQHASLVDQLAAARGSVRSNRSILDLLVRRQQLGAIGQIDVVTQQTAVANAEAAVPPLVRALQHQRALVSALIGQSPGNPLPELPTLTALALPADLPVSLPAQLVEHRPDVRAAAAQMRGAGADVGAAIAARLPAITLSANAGGVAETFGRMFADGNPFWTLIGGVAQPLFRGGALLRQQRAAEAALEGAKAQYRAAVIQAFVDVSDALTGLRTDADALDASARAEVAASQNLRFATRQAELGQVGTLQLLNAASSRAQAQAQLVQARAARLSDSVALYQALGGSW